MDQNISYPLNRSRVPKGISGIRDPKKTCYNTCRNILTTQYTVKLQTMHNYRSTHLCIHVTMLNEWGGEVGV